MCLWFAVGGGGRKGRRQVDATLLLLYTKVGVCSIYSCMDVYVCLYDCFNVCTIVVDKCCQFPKCFVWYQELHLHTVLQ